MDSIRDMLRSRKPSEPPQIQALKLYVRDNHGVEILASTSQFGYTITVPNAPLAATLRMEIPQIKLNCNLDKKLFIRIGMIK